MGQAIYPVRDICADIIDSEDSFRFLTNAIHVLGSHNNKQSANILLQVVERDQKYEDDIRLYAIREFNDSEIRNVNFSKIPDHLIKIVNSKQAIKLRKEAILALKHYPLDEVIKVLEEALKDSRSEIRGGAVESLAYIGSADSIDALIELVKSEKRSTKVKEKLISALQQFDSYSRVQEVLETISIFQTKSIG